MEKVRPSPTYIQGSGLQKNQSHRPNSFPKYPNKESGNFPSVGIFLVSGLPDLELFPCESLSRRKKKRNELVNDLNLYPWQENGFPVEQLDSVLLDRGTAGLLQGRHLHKFQEEERSEVP